MQPIQILEKYWGYESFRPMQYEIIHSAMNGDDTLALLPTGGGKSICYQIPALALPGVCIVISPLIALMKDQVFQLQKRGIPAVAIYSGMHYTEIDGALDNCIYGKTKLLYLSPERLTSDLVKERIKKMKVNLLAVDEAHCISQWGYDFRPPYLRIAEIRELLPNVPILAVTATATKEVAVDIQEKLEFKKSKAFFQQSFERKNLAYVVLNEDGKVNKMVDILQKVKGSAIVYARNRRKTKELADHLKRNKISADYYHAGLTHQERSAKQDAWISNQTSVMVATNAFGMGIDKADVRSVVHMDLPDSLEAYFQEAGRAGRDGKKSYAVLLYSAADKERLTKYYEESYPEVKQIRQVYRALGSYFQLAVGGGIGDAYDFNLGEFAQRFDFKAITAFNSLKILKDAGWIDLTESVYIPAKLQVKVSKEELYNFEITNHGFEKLIKTILRTYQGAFSQYVKINEGKLSKFLGINLGTLHKMLLHLDQEDIIDFIPPKDKPQLLFLKERVAAENMTIDMDLYNFLKNRHWERLKQVFKYATEEQCRSKMLLEYFDEKNEEPCGICDHCLGRHNAELTEDDYYHYKNKIRELIIQKPVTLEELIDKFSSIHQSKILKVVDYLLDNQYLRQTNDQRIAWNGKPGDNAFQTEDKSK